MNVCLHKYDDEYKVEVRTQGHATGEMLTLAAVESLVDTLTACRNVMRKRVKEKSDAG